MTLDEIKEEVIVRSGQWILAPDKLEVKDAQFKALVRAALRKFNRHCPYDKRMNLNIGNLSLIFSDAVDPGIPDFIADVTPIRSSGGFGVFQQVSQPYSRYPTYEFPQVKREFTYRYRKPILYVPFGGDFDVWVVKRHVIVDRDGKDSIVTFDQDANADNNDSFFDYLVGSFLVSLGRYRNAFTIPGGPPITMDSADMKRDGKAMMDEAEADMINGQKKFYLAWGG